MSSPKKWWTNHMSFLKPNSQLLYTKYLPHTATSSNKFDGENEYNSLSKKKYVSLKYTP